MSEHQTVDLTGLLSAANVECATCNYSLPLARFGITRLVWQNDGIPLGTLRFPCPECPGEALLQVWYWWEDAA